MENDSKTISSFGTCRLPRYWRCLKEMLCEGALRTTSGELGKRLSLSASQIRADLRGMSGAGQQGYGYDVKTLYKAISRRLGVGEGFTAILIGGNEGMASYLTACFEGRGILLVSRFCSSPQPGKHPEELMTQQLSDYLLSRSIDMAVILDCEDCPVADLTDLLIRSGIRGIWNATQKEINAGVPIINFPFGDIMMALGHAIIHDQQSK